MKIETIKEFSVDVTRYILGIIMMSYGLVKIFQIQFALPPDVYERTLNQLDGVTLTWSFLGFSIWFSTALGIFELLAGLLLLFKKTELIAALLLFPMLLGILLINMAFGFLPQMKVFSATLVILNVILLYTHRSAYLSFFGALIHRNIFSVRELILNVTILVVIAFLIAHFHL